MEIEMQDKAEMYTLPQLEKMVKTAVKDFAKQYDHLRVENYDFKIRVPLGEWATAVEIIVDMKLVDKDDKSVKYWQSSICL